MPIFAMSSHPSMATIVPSFCNRITNIVEISAYKKVLRIAATWVVAPMTDMQRR